MKKTIMSLVIVLFLSVSMVQATIYHVKTTGNDANSGTSWSNAFRTLEKALSVVTAGDEIWVAAGTYQPPQHASYRMVNNVAIYGGFKGYETSYKDRDWESDQSILQGNGNSVIRNEFSENDRLGDQAILEGFIITGGGAADLQNGGGIYNYYASPTIQNCIITNCTAGMGGGVYNSDSNPIMGGCIITECFAVAGGGIYNTNSHPYIVNCTIKECIAEQGGGIYNSPENCHAAYIHSCRIEACTALSNGGGMSGGATVVNSVISKNKADETGGGFYTSRQDTLTLQNVLIERNSANAAGGGMSINHDSHIKISGATISGNHAGIKGGGIAYMTDFSWTVIEICNSIIWGNTAPSNDQRLNNILSYKDYQGYTNETPGIISFNHSLIEGSIGYGNWNPLSGINQGGNIDTDPLFVHFPASIQDEGNFRLSPCSPAINAGDNACPRYYQDLDRNPRVHDDIIDMGAYEFPGISGRLYVNRVNQNTLQNGLSWPTAYTKLEDAIAYAQDNAPCYKEIWVAQGMYQPAPDSSYTMQNNLKIYGGFLGTEQSLHNRNWENNTTVLQGNNSAVIRNIFTEENPLDSTAVLDGFIITDGMALTDEAYAGGGIYNEFASPTIQNCSIEYCMATFGGGVCNVLSNPIFRDVIIQYNITMSDGGGMGNIESSPELTRVSIMNNDAEGGYGGGLYNDGGEFNSMEVKITGNIAATGGGIYNNYTGGSWINTQLSGNTAGTGGGIYNFNSNVDFTNIQIVGNKAHTNGGGIYNTDAGTVYLTNARITGNVATTGGGIYNSDRSYVYLTNGTVSGNYAGTGGGIYNASSRLNTLVRTYIKNSIIWGNRSASTTGINIHNTKSTNTAALCIVDAAYSIIEGGSGSNFWTTNRVTNSGNNTDANPMFVLSRYASNANTPVSTGNFRLLQNSPAINTGYNAYNITPTDLDGNSRIVENFIDMGAYEFQFAKSLIVSQIQETEEPEDNLTEVAGQISINVYPNPVPAGNNVTLEFSLLNEDSGMEADIYNILGMNVGKHRITDPHTTIALPEAKGQYFIKISGKDGFMQVKKVIVM